MLKSLAKPPRESAATGRTLLGKALPAVRRAVAEIEASGLADRVSEAGSVRRRVRDDQGPRPDRHGGDPPALTAFFAEREWVAEVVAQGGTKATVVSHEGFRFDLRVVPPESYGNLLQHFTGSKDHNVALREDAVQRGLSVSEYGVLDVESGETFQAGDEEQVYARLGYAWIPPELRENRGELEAARDGALPATRRARRPEGRPPHAHGLVGRARDARGDGAGGEGARAPLRRHLRPRAAPP